MLESNFSSTYEEARSRFIQRATAVNANLVSHSLQIEEAAADEFTIDVAILGPEDAPAVVTSSGVHGVEGFLGSAIQLAKLKELESGNPDGIRWVFIHAINPVGFSRIRRFNEDNIDLNRNFLADDSQYAGAPADYGRLNRFLNPKTGPSPYEPFLIKAVWNIARYGMGALRQAIAEGQYEYPSGIFYGGSGPSQAMLIIRDHFAQWIGSAQHIFHADFHSGLGPYGEYKLLLAELVGSDECQWYEKVFGSESIEATEASADTAYRAAGPIGEWLQQHFAARDYRFVTAEFGTYGPIRVLASIRAENQAHHFGNVNSRAYRKAKQELLECFSPADPAWKRKVVAAGLEILQQGVRGLLSK